MFELAGSTANEFDQLKIGGAAWVDGILVMSPSNGYRPKASDRFVVPQAAFITKPVRERGQWKPRPLLCCFLALAVRGPAGLWFFS